VAHKANEVDRVFKRRINELEQDIKKIQREVLKLKQMKKDSGRTRKGEQRALVREMDVQEVLDDLQAEEFRKFQCVVSEDSGIPGVPTYRCRNSVCQSNNVTTIAAGLRLVVVCEECKSKHTIMQDSGFAETG